MNSFDTRNHKSIQNRVIIAFCVIVLLLISLAFVPAVDATDTKLTYTDHNGRVGNAEQIDSSTMITVGRYNSENGKIWSYDAGAGTYNTKLTYTDHNDRIYDVEVLPSGNIISSDGSGNAKIWSYDAGAGTYNTKLTYTDHSGSIYDVKVLSSGNILTASTDNTVKIWSYDAGDGTYDIKINYTGHSGGIRDTTILPSGDVASASGDNTVKIWSYDAGAGTYNTKLTYTDHSNSLFTVEYLSDTGLIASGGSNDIIKIWSYDAGAGTYNTKLTYTDHSGYGINDIEEIASGDIVSVSSSAKVWNYDAGAGKYNTNTTYNGHGESSIFDAQQLKSGYIITSSVDNTAQIWDTNYGLQAPSQKIAKPVSIVDVKKPSNSIEIYGINNTDLKNGDTIDISWGDGSVDTVTYNTTSTYTHTYSSDGDYTITMTADESRSTNVTIHSDPTPSIDLVPSNNVFEGEPVEFRANNSTSGTTASRPTTDPLTVTSGLVQYNAFYTENSKDSFYSGSYHNYQNRTAFTPAKSPTNKGVAYWSTSNESYQTIPVNLSESWTITSYHNTNPSETSIIWASPSGHGVAVKNSDLIRITPSQNITVNSSVDYNSDGHNITVTHDADGSFDYYIDGSYAGSDGSVASIADDAYVIQGANSISGVTQSDYTLIDDWRIYDTNLTTNQVSNLHDNYNIDIPSGIDYEWTIDSSFLSSQEIYNETGGFNTGSYSVELTAQNADGLTKTASTTLTVSDVVKPRIDNLSPIGDQNTRDVDIKADVSHPNISSSYKINVTLTRLNKITGNVKQLKNVNISSNKTVIYNADHTNTGISNYNVKREDFEYEWISVEPNQLKTATESANYSIPVTGGLDVENIQGKGLIPDRDVTLSADITSSYSQSVDVKLKLYDARKNTTNTVYTNTVTTNSTVSHTVSLPNEESSIPSDYDENNRFSYRWFADSGSINISSQTNIFRLTGMAYVINDSGSIIQQQTTIGSDVEPNGTHFVSNLTTITNVANFSADVSSSGYINSSIFVDQYSRSYTTLLYDSSNTDVFNQTFGTPSGDFDFSKLNVDKSYLILKTDKGGDIYTVTAESFDTNGEVTATVKDNVTYQLSIYDGTNRRSIGSWTANINDQSKEEIEPRSIDFVSNDSWVWDVNTTYDRPNGTGYIDVKFSSNEDNIENLDVDIIRQNDSKIVFSDNINGKVDTYSTNVSVPNGTYQVLIDAYDLDTNTTITASESVTFGVKQVLDGIPQVLLTWLAALLILVVGASLSMVSTPFGLSSVIALGTLFVMIGWLPISITVVVQAAFIAVLYYLSRDDIG